MIVDLGKKPSVLSAYMAELRDVNIQTDPYRFRRNLERIGEFIGYEISRELEYEIRDVTTPLGIAPVSVLKKQPVVATILRAGLPLHQGLLNVFDRAENAFISAYRKHHKDGTFDVQVEYMSSPSLDDKILIL
ncbi:MAG: uracil phosphoribosyltransferase, partial [Bacteroidia bacterium]